MSYKKSKSRVRHTDVKKNKVYDERSDSYIPLKGALIDAYNVTTNMKDFDMLHPSELPVPSYQEIPLPFMRTPQVEQLSASYLPPVDYNPTIIYWETLDVGNWDEWDVVWGAEN